ncbi:hypothetical protein EV426DRAFT_20875 [Tirmania nivea]|nr:hypothetical protein EV426DRAFT_20875 [Tirmania nivea]
MASVNSDHNNAPRRSGRDGSITPDSREQSPKRTVVQPLDLRKTQSSKTGKAQTTDRDIKPKRLMLQGDMVYSSGFEELADQVLNSIPVTASSSSQSSASRRPPSPPRRQSSKLPTHQYCVTAPSSPRHIDDITPIDAPLRSGIAPQNYSRKSGSYSHAHSVDYTNYSGAAPTHQNGRKSFHHESPQSLPSRRPHQRHSSTATASSARRLSHYTFESPHTGTPSYSYSPEEYNVDESHIPGGDGGLDIPSSMGMPNLQMASNAVMKANLRSGDPYPELSRFLDNVNGMLSSLTLSIPHLQLLCDRYRSIQEKLLEYNALVQVNRAQEEAIEQKERQIFSLKEKLNQMVTMHSAEGNRLWNKIGGLEVEIRIFNDIIAAKNNEIQELASIFEEEKESLRSEGEQLGVASEEAFLEEKLELLEKHDAEIEILEEGHNARIKEIEEAHAIEKANMMRSSELKIKDLEERHQAELNEIFEKKASEMNEIHHQVVLQLEKNHSAKLATLKDAHGVDMRALESKFYAKLETLKVDVGKRRADLERAHAAEKKLQEEEFQKERALWIAEKEQLEGQIKYLQYEKNTTAFTHEAEKSSLLEKVQSSEQLTRQLEKENERINDVLKRIGDADWGQEIKSRGDGFYIDAFTTLTKDIVDISTKFLDLPRMPPGDVIAEIPSNLPNILADTDASRILRQAYIQHVISTILCKRIFSPFLFSLANRYDNADSLLKAMSLHLRKKSTRREAVWRNYTLIAAYTANSAKQHAAAAATTVIDEIITKIRPFAESENMDRIFAGVRRVVKYAIDTWRYARLEKEMFVARVETEADDPVWGHHPYEKQFPYVSDSNLIESIQGSFTGKRKLVLHLLPLIYREGTVPSISQQDTVLDDGHVFTYGIALFSDCLPVLSRKMELGTLDSNSSSCGEDRVQKRKELEKSDRAVDDLPVSRHIEDARMRAQQMEKEEAQRLEREKEEAWRLAELEELKRKEEEEARLQEESERKKEEARLKAEWVEVEKRELARIQAEKEEQLRVLEEVRIKAQRQEEEAREAALMETIELESLARIEAEIESAAKAEAQLIAEQKEQRERESLLEAAQELARMELEAQRVEDEDRENTLQELAKLEQWQAEQDMLARVEVEIRDAEEAEAQLVAEEKEKMGRLMLEAEAKARADEEMERERLKLRQIRRKEVRAKIEAEVAAKKLERERARERQRLKVETEEKEREAERQALAEVEAEAERLRLESETERDLLQDKTLTAVVGGGTSSKLEAIEEVDDVRSDVMSDAEVSTLGRGIAEAASMLSLGMENFLRGAADSEVGRSIPETIDGRTKVANEGAVRDVAERTMGQAREIVIENATGEVVPETLDRGLPVDEGASMIWLRLSEPETHFGVSHTQEGGEQGMTGPIHAYEGGHSHIPISELSKERSILRLQDRSVTPLQEYENAPAGAVTDLDSEYDCPSEVKPHTVNEEVKQIKADMDEMETEEFISRKTDRQVDEDVSSIYSDGGGTYLSQPGEEPLVDEGIEEELDLDDESFDSCGASVGGQDDEESDYERGVDGDEEEAFSRKTAIREEEDDLTELPPLPPIALEGQTPGGVELASFDFGLGAERDGEDYGADSQWAAEDWEVQHGVAESSGEEGGNVYNAGRRHVARGLAFVAQEGHENQKDGKGENPELKGAHAGNYQGVHVVGRHETEVHQGECV